jgi:hypothetical protein
VKSFIFMHLHGYEMQCRAIKRFRFINSNGIGQVAQRDARQPEIGGRRTIVGSENDGGV